MLSTKRLAILGRQPELGLLELESLLGSNNLTPFGQNSTIFEGEVEFATLGGVIKVADVLYDGPAGDLLELGLDWAGLARPEGKTIFGLSYYGKRVSPRSVLATGLELKKRLKPTGAVRLISPQVGTELTAAQILNYRLLSDGFELLVVTHGSRMVVARTTDVQDINWYSRRDYERPARSAKVGMLPPKLAQVLVNTIRGQVVVDPFCGTGVVLQEALLSGRDVVGSDLSPEMVAASRRNLDWLGSVTSQKLGHWNIMEAADARTVTLPDANCAIVSEGYLGEHLSAAPSPAQVSNLADELRGLYLAALGNFARQLAPGAEVAICVPSWRMKSGWFDLDLVDDTRKLGYAMKVFKHVPGIVRYGRSDQIVGRQLYLLTRS